MRRILPGALGVLLLVVTSGCAAPPYEARGMYSPAEASQILREHPSHAWIVSGNERRELGVGGRIEADGAGFRAVPAKGRGGSHVRKLEDGDAVIVDEAGHVIGIRARSGAETAFAPGSASLPPNSDEVLVQETADVEGTRLAAGDKIEVLASYAPGDKVPGLGHVEESRKLIPLVAGSLLFAITYGPVAYVGFASSLKIDRTLLVPGLGPWIDLLARPKCTPPDTPVALPVDACTGETAAKVGLVTSGLGQAVGIVLIVLGLPAEAVLVKDNAATLRVGPFGARGEF